MRLGFDPDGSPAYPHGYWFAVTDDGGYDADGATPVDALAALVKVLEEK
jgi:hypothetical protein